MIAHALNLACLFTLFLAFHQTVSLGVLVAGYAMGMLFLIVSITLQGIGKRQDLMVAVVSIVLTVWLTYLRLRFERPSVLTGLS